MAGFQLCVTTIVCLSLHVLSTFAAKPLDEEASLSLGPSDPVDGTLGVASQSYKRCRGKTIDSYVIRTYKVRSQLSCVRDCMVHMHCRSAVVCKTDLSTDIIPTIPLKSDSTNDTSAIDSSIQNGGSRNIKAADDAPAFDASQTEVMTDDVTAGNASLECILSAFTYTKCQGLPDAPLTCSALIMKHWCKNGGKPRKFKWRCDCPYGYEGTFCQTLSVNDTVS